MIELDGASLTIEKLVAIADGDEVVTLSSAAAARVRASRVIVDRRALGTEPAYGINTGFGSFADVKIAPGALDAIHVFFPDPWPKARHHKRRLVRPGNVALLRERLRPGGLLHCATDWPDYAAAMAQALAGDPGLRPAGDERPARPETKFERRGTLAGRPITDLRYVRS